VGEGLTPQGLPTMATALERHLALIGFMGAGKSTLGASVAERLDRRFVDLDREIEGATATPIPQLFERRGEDAFREVEERLASDVLVDPAPAVIALGGGAVLSPRTRGLLADRAVTVLVDVDVETAWRRAADSARPLARDEAAFRRLYDERQPLYDEVADARACDADGIVLAAGGIRVEPGALERLGDLLPDQPLALVADSHVAGIYGPTVQGALGHRLASRHVLPQGEDAKTPGALGRLWSELRLDRDGLLVALGGGTTTDAAGFAAATYLRGIEWAAVPTTLVGQVDAAIGGKTAVDLPEGKNLVGAFHWPVRTVIDPGTLETLPDRERLAGMSEVVKTGLLAGERLWELALPELVRRCAAFKTAVCLRDPKERGDRAILNLGHTFAHALEAGSNHEVAHGEAVALGLLAALRLSGLEAELGAIEDVLRPRPVRADRERAWAALGRDKKRAGGKTRLVLLEAPGRPRTGVELPDEEVRRELDRLIAG
jgi:shikimate kinase / 3-dehydroquinate synthase